eukprot:TRINITY_DN94807_c0_g1_i1.p2 TRINITY_DN94807_c0_g1~~TRINITY_DN94807_c0_g1_i1.p2  ORF type:complete len:178 (+),score=41.63 TRINITY_DN94807_c0_g1_i1:69-536(+)
MGLDTLFIPPAAKPAAAPSGDVGMPAAAKRARPEDGKANETSSALEPIGKRDLKAIGLVALESKQMARMVMSITMLTWLIPTNLKPITEYMLKAGRDYHNETSKHKGHKLGPPGPYLWAGLICGLLEFINLKEGESDSLKDNHSLQFCKQTLDQH